MQEKKNALIERTNTIAKKGTGKSEFIPPKESSIGKCCRRSKSATSTSKDNTETSKRDSLCQKMPCSRRRSKSTNRQGFKGSNNSLDRSYDDDTKKSREKAGLIGRMCSKCKCKRNKTSPSDSTKSSSQSTAKSGLISKVCDKCKCKRNKSGNTSESTGNTKSKEAAKPGLVERVCSKCKCKKNKSDKTDSNTSEAKPGLMGKICKCKKNKNKSSDNASKSNKGLLGKLCKFRKK